MSCVYNTSREMNYLSSEIDQLENYTSLLNKLYVFLRKENEYTLLI